MWWVLLLRWVQSQKTPEMNELDSVKKSLTFLAPNSKNSLRTRKQLKIVTKKNICGELIELAL